MNNKIILLENKKNNIKDMFILKASSINTMHDINKEAKDIIDKYYLYESFNGHLLVFAEYDIKEDKDIDENSNLKSMIDYFLDLDNIDNTFLHFIFSHEHPSIIYIEKRNEKNPRYHLINAVGLYEEVTYESPHYRMTTIAEYCKDLLDDTETDDDFVEKAKHTDIIVTATLNK